jgi:isocitrate/isopropylmalate dehydrogenase
MAIQESVNTRRGVERCLRYAFELAANAAAASPGAASSPKT